MEVQQYSDQDWAVRRWDSFNGGKQIEPKSFCQFWRTILLWATLASIPLIGRVLFLTHLIEKPPAKKWSGDGVSERRIAALRKIVDRPAAFVWWLLWPVRIVLYGAWRATATVVAFVDERDTRWLETALFGALLLVAVVAFGFLLIVLGLALAGAWRENWPVFLAIALGVPLLLASVFLLALRFGSSIMSFFQVVWGVAVASKHRVCPPMVIARAVKEAQ